MIVRFQNGRPFEIALALALVALAHDGAQASTAPAGYQYLSPIPGARFVRPQTNVIVREGHAIDSTTVSADRLQAVGELSGAHSGTLALSDDGATLIFTPDAPFAYGEDVTVSLAPGVLTAAGDSLPPFASHFGVAGAPGTGPRFDAIREEWAEAVGPLAAAGAGALGAPIGPAHQLDAVSCDSLPTLCPRVTVLQHRAGEQGTFLLAPFNIGGFIGKFGNLMMVDDRGQVLFWRHRSGEVPMDFERFPDGQLGYVGRTAAYLLDSAFAITDSIKTGNGYDVDVHEFKPLPNGHVLLMAYDPETVPMDSLVTGGRHGATVQGLIVQELDRARRVCFQWRSWDYIPITDCQSGLVDLTAANIDYIHGNAIEPDVDGNLLVSSRHLSEITKIDRATGDMIWRMGQHAKQNQFTFTNDGRGYSHQHDIRRLPNGHLTLFDNGNFGVPELSRALEYQIDETTKTATLVWQYLTFPTTFGSFMGNVQRHPDGGTTICWGGSNPSFPRVTDLDSDGTVQLKLGLPDGMWSYRCYRLDAPPTAFSARPQQLDFSAATSNGVERGELTVAVRNGSGHALTFNCLALTNSQFTTDLTLPRTVAAGDSLMVPVRFQRAALGDLDERMYLKAVTDSELVTVPVRLRAVERLPSGIGLAAVRSPARGATQFRIELPATAAFRLEIYDLAGRRVSTVASGTLLAGGHLIDWSAPARPGVYFARLAVGARSVTRRVVRL